MLAFATIWHLDGASRLLLFWPENERTGPAFAAANNFSRVQHHFVLQRGIRITADWHTFVHEPAFWYEHDGAKSQDLFPSTISRTFNRPLPQVQRAYAHIRTRLVKPSDSLSRVLQRLPVDFIGLHLRRGDKVRPNVREACRTHTKRIGRPAELGPHSQDTRTRTHAFCFSPPSRVAGPPEWHRRARDKPADLDSFRP
eukprot:5203681-Prymnesium_polylepis.1